MAKPVFSKEDFLEAADNDGTFDAVASGTYIATIEKTATKISKGGARQVSIGYQIDKEDEDFAGQYVWWQQTTVNKDGAPNLIGLQIYNKLLHQLSDNQFSPDDFEWDTEGNISNEEGVLAKLEGTQVRLKVNNKGKKDSYDDIAVTVQQVMESTYGASTTTEPLEEDNKELEKTMQTEVAAAASTEERPPTNVGVGDQVGWYAPDGVTEIFGIIEHELDDGTGDGLFVIKPLRGGDKAKRVSKAPGEVFVLIEEEVVEEEPKKPDLAPGVLASYKFNGETIEAEINKVDEDTGLVHFLARNAEGNKVRRKVKIADVTVV